MYVVYLIELSSYYMPHHRVHKSMSRSRPPSYPLEFNVIFREGITLRHELTAESKIPDPVPAMFKHVTNIVTCTLLCYD